MSAFGFSDPREKAGEFFFLKSTFFNLLIKNLNKKRKCLFPFLEKKFERTNIHVNIVRRNKKEKKKINTRGSSFLAKIFFRHSKQSLSLVWQGVFTARACVCGVGCGVVPVLKHTYFLSTTFLLYSCLFR